MTSYVITISQIVSLGSEFELTVLELGELTTPANHVIHPTSDGLSAEVCVLVTDKTATFGFVSYEMVFAGVKLMVEGGFEVLVHPD